MSAAGCGRRVLVVMAKDPVPGSVKTRLAPALGLDGGARLYRAFLDDLLERFGRWPDVEPVLAVWPPGADPAAEHPRGSRWRRVAQRGAGLGERMDHAFRTELPEDGSLVLLGSDAPTLPGRRVLAAFRELEREGGAEVVLAPDAGGGYCLVGMRRYVAGLFGVRMSTASVFEETCERVRVAGARLAVLSPGRAVDVPEDLERLRRELGTPRARRLAPCTARALAELDGRAGFSSDSPSAL